MQLLTSLARLRSLPRPDVGWGLVWVASLAAIEGYGRRADSDIGDGISVAVIYGLFLGTALRHTVRPIPLIRSLETRARRIARLLTGWRVRFGVDLREEPPLPRGFPMLLGQGLLIALLFFCLTTWLRPWVPGAARELVSQLSYALYAFGLAAFWAILAGTALLLFFVPLAWLETTASAHLPRLTRRRRVFGLGVGQVLVLLLGTTLLPVWLPLAVVATVACFLILVANLRRAPQLWIVWKEERPHPRNASAGWMSLTAAFHVIGALVGIGLVTLTNGDQRFGHLDTMPITAFLGSALAWSLVFVYGLQMVELSRLLHHGFFRNPEHQMPTRVQVHAPDDELARRASKGLRLHGFNPIEHGQARPSDVSLQLDEDPVDPTFWPRLASADQIDDPGLAAALQRRAALLHRRALRRGLRKLFKLAGALDFEKGSGFWLGPHRWFLTHLTRDQDEERAWTIGPPYREVFPLEARHHLWQVLSALHLDIIFVEDGVGHRRFQRVLGALFEFYDMFDGQRPFDERTTLGLPGVRTIVHEFDLSAQKWKSPYPEPSFEDLGRARILHVFRDRGEGFEDPVTPRERDHMPASGPPVPAFFG